MENELAELQHRLLEMLLAFQRFTNENGLTFFLVGGSALGAVRHKGFIPWDDDIDIAMFRDDFEKLEGLLAEWENHIEDFVYSPVEQHFFPEAPIGYLYDLTAGENGSEVNAKIDIHPIDGVPDRQISRRFQYIASLVYYLSVYRLPVKNKGKVIRALSKVILRVVPEAMFRFLMKYCKRLMTRWNTKDSKCVCSLFGIAGYAHEIMPRSYLEPFVEAEFETGCFLIPGNPHSYLQQLYGNYMELPPEEQRHPQIHYNGYRAGK